MASESWKHRLEPFAIAFAGLSQCLEGKTLDELRQLRDDCDKATTTNCWSYIYRVAQFLRRELDEQIRAEDLAAPRAT